MARRRPKSAPAKSPPAKARAPKAEELGRRVAEGPNGSIHELLVDGVVVGWLEHAADPLAVAALQDRAARLATLRHPFLSRSQGLRAVGESQGLLTDASGAVDLAELCLAGPVPTDVAVDLFRKVARALHAGWDLQTRKQPAEGLIHGCLDARDIWVDAAGAVRLHGLGLIAPGGGQEGSHPATARRESQATAPERLRGEPPTHAGDVYSLGAWLVRAISGQDAPWASSSAAWQEATAASAVQQVLEHSDETALGELVGRMLSFEPEQRPTALAVEQQLDRLRKAQDREALPRWAAVAVPSARGSIEVRQGFERDEAASAGPPVDDEEPTAEVEPISNEYSDFVDSVDPSAAGHSVEDPSAADPSAADPSEKGGIPQDSMAARRLWEIRGPIEPGGPSRILEWGEPSPPETGPGDPRLLRDELDEMATDNSGEVLDLGTGQFVVGEGGLKPVEDSETLGVAVVPGAAADAQAKPASRAEPVGRASNGERPPRVPSAPPVGPQKPGVPSGKAGAGGAAAGRTAPARPPRPPADRRPSPPPPPPPAEEPTDWTWLAAAALAVVVVLGLLWWAWASPANRTEPVATPLASAPASTDPATPAPLPPAPAPPEPAPPEPAPPEPEPEPDPDTVPMPPPPAPEPDPAPSPPKPAPQPAAEARTAAPPPPRADPSVPPPPIPVR